MPLPYIRRHTAKAAITLVGIVALAGCTASNSLVTTRTQGYEISESALQQVRPGQSQELVQVVLGTPQVTNSFGSESAWYYVQTKVSSTAFGLETIESRTVLAVYFDSSERVSDTAVYGLEDGNVITMEGHRTPSYGEDRTFIESILSSVGL